MGLERHCVGLGHHLKREEKVTVSEVFYLFLFK